MFKLPEAMIGFLLVAQVASAILFLSPAERIDEYLEKSLPDIESLRENLRVAIKWKHELQFQADTAVFEGLSTLEALDEALKYPLCDDSTYDIVDESIKFVGEECIIPNANKDSLSRTQKMVRSAAHRIAKFCHREHKNKFFKRLSKLDAGLIKKAEFLGRFCWRTDILATQGIDCNRDSKSNLSDIIQNVLNQMKTKDNPEFKYLRATSDERGREIVKKDKVKQLVKQYITEPCHYLMNSLGDLISIARRDSEIMSVFHRDWLKREESPFGSLLPAHCVCGVIVKAGYETVARKTFELVPKAKYH